MPKELRKAGEKLPDGLRPIADIPQACSCLQMSSDGYWRVQPAWVKVLTVCTGVPAFVVLVADVGGRFETIALIMFGIVAAIQAAFVFQAFWHMDL